MPWRLSRDPYQIWVSEVMLQQTTVAAVVPFFERFIRSFPTVTALAAADEQDVLAHWSGLGYYRRARHLHTAAKRLVAGHGEALPDDPAVWAELPGVGRYILGAVLSQAFERRLPVVEANTLRVLSRLYGSRGDPREGLGKVWVWNAAEALLPSGRVGDFNQAMMELGALICAPTNPKCDTCPVANSCEANRLGLQSVIPPPPKAKLVLDVREVGLVIRRGAEVLWCQRPLTAKRWAGMWEVPHGECLANESIEDAATRLAPELIGRAATPGREAHTLTHGVTRFRITLCCLECELHGKPVSTAHYPAFRWVTPSELGGLPVSSPQRALAKALASGVRGLF